MFIDCPLKIYNNINQIEPKNKVEPSESRVKRDIVVRNLITREDVEFDQYVQMILEDIDEDVVAINIRFDYNNVAGTVNFMSENSLYFFSMAPFFSEENRFGEEYYYAAYKYFEKVYNKKFNVYHVFMRTTLPQMPQLLKKPKNSLSVSKSQSTTYELFLKAIEHYGLSRENYEDFLDYLKENEIKYYERIKLKDFEEEKLEKNYKTYCEIIDVIKNNPFKLKSSACRACKFKRDCWEVI